MKKNRGTKRPIKIGNTSSQNQIKNKKLRSVVETIEKKSVADLENHLVSENLQENYDIISNIFDNSFGFTLRKFSIGENNTESFIIYIDGMVNREAIHENILKPLMTEFSYPHDHARIHHESFLSDLKDTLISISDVTPIHSIKEAVKFVLLGHCVLFVNNNDVALSMNTLGIESRSVSDPIVETSLRGPMEAFVENIQINTSLIRRRIRTPNLKMEKFTVGRLSQTDVVMCYIKGIANEGILKEVKERIEKIDTDIILEGGQLESFSEDSWISPFPQTEITERPDSCVASLAEGRIVLVINGSPFVLIVPVALSYFFTAAEDYYHKFYFASFVRLLRYFAFLITLVLPSFYVAITTYHQEMIPSVLLISIANARAEIPFPAVVEALFMEITFEIIREAGARLPLSIGQSLSIVGGLVIGSTAVDAGLVSPGMVIVVAVTAIASFIIPKINSSRAISVLRFPILFLASTMGIFGIIVGLLILLIHLASLRSFGVPYLSPYTPLSLENWKDSFIKLPAWFIFKRPAFLEPENLVRTDLDSEPKPPNTTNYMDEEN